MSKSIMFTFVLVILLSFFTYGVANAEELKEEKVQVCFKSIKDEKTLKSLCFTSTPRGIQALFARMKPELLEMFK